MLLRHKVDAAHYGLGWAVRDAGRAGESDRQFEKVHDDFRSSRFWNDATFRLAESAWRLGNTIGQASFWRSCWPRSRRPKCLPTCFICRARLAAGRQKWDEVEARMDQVAHDFASSSLGLPAAYWVAEAEYRQGKFDEAGKRLAALAERVGGPTTLGWRWFRYGVHKSWRKRQWADAQSLASQIQHESPNFNQQYEVDYLLGRSGSASRFRRRGARISKGNPFGRRWQNGNGCDGSMDDRRIVLPSGELRRRVARISRVEILYAYPRWQAAALLQAGKCQELLGEGDVKRLNSSAANQILSEHGIHRRRPPTATRYRGCQQLVRHRRAKLRPGSVTKSAHPTFRARMQPNDQSIGGQTRRNRRFLACAAKPDRTKRTGMSFSLPAMLVIGLVLAGAWTGYLRRALAQTSDSPVPAMQDPAVAALAGPSPAPATSGNERRAPPIRSKGQHDPHQKPVQHR